jgi:5'-nucleotidase
MPTISTFSGQVVSLENPRPEQIHIADIARGLARQARFAGQTTHFYSVAQHSVLASRMCSQFPLAALLHDATEAYISDIPRPVKSLSPAIKEIEARLFLAIAQRFDIESTIPTEVADVDDQLLVTEHRDLQPNGPAWDLLAWPPPTEQLIVPWPACQAEAAFLKRFRDLTQGKSGK